MVEIKNFLLSQIVFFYAIVRQNIIDGADFNK